MCIKQQTNRIWTGGPDPDGNKVALQLYRWIGDGDLENGPDGADPLDEFANGVLIPKEAVGEVHYVDQQTGWSSQKLNDIYNHEGQPYQYTIREVHSPYTVWPNPERYEQKITGNKETDADGNPTAWNFTVSNEYRSPQTDIVASKIWIGGDYSYPRILIDLFRYPEGKEQEKELVVDGKSSATTQFSPYHVYKEMDLTNEEGIPYVYRIEEREITELTQELIGLGFTQADIDALQNYKTERNKEEDPLGVNDENLSIINRYVSPLIKVNATKVWEGGNPDNRPVVTLQLLQNGVPYNGEEGETDFQGTVTLKHGETEASWFVPLTDPFEQEYRYQVVETDVPKNYTDTYSEPILDKLDSPKPVSSEPNSPVYSYELSQTVTNTYAPDTIEVVAEKEWKGGPDEKPFFELQLYRTVGEDEPIAVGAPVVLRNETSYTWYVEETDADERPYVYSILETAVPVNYEASYEEAQSEYEAGELVRIRQKVINTFAPNNLTIAVQKYWLGGANRPDVQVGLYHGNEPVIDNGGNPRVITLTEENDWSGTFTDVPAIDDALQLIEYRVEEVVPDDYTASYEGDQTTGFRIINTYVSPEKDVTATKEWIGGKDRKEVTLQLLQNGIPFGEPVKVDGIIDANETFPWSYTWKNMPETDTSGTPYLYTVREDNIPENYVATYDGLRVINTYVPGYTEFTVHKKWENGPAETPVALFRLYRSTEGGTEEAVGGYAAAVNNTYTWTDLPVTDKDGNPYTYRAEEINIPANYTAQYSEAENNTVTVTNVYHAPVGSITANKVWIDGPAEKPAITLALYRAKGTEAPEAVPQAAPMVLQNGTLQAVWENIALTDTAGNAYTFSVVETDTPAQV